jgi:hypothetical protein
VSAPEVRVLLDDVVYTDYGQFTLEWLVEGAGPYTDHRGGNGDPRPSFAGQRNGWVGAAQPTLVHIVLARRSGGSAVRIEWHAHAPAETDAEDVVEVSTSIPRDARRMWFSWAGESGGVLDLPAGDARVRVSAWGRDAGSADEFADGVVDRYLIQIWPSPWRSDAVIRSVSADAAYWNAEWGGAQES